MSSGFLYVADTNHVAEAVDSARSVKAAMTDAEIAIATDADSTPDVFDKSLSLGASTWDWDVRIKALKGTPFDRTVYLDTDVYAVEPVSDLFELLGTYDLAAAHAPVRQSVLLTDTNLSQSRIPGGFPEFNCGVLAYRDVECVQDVFTRWIDRYQSHREQSPQLHDQPAFREAVYNSSVRVVTLPPEYNLRLPFHGFASGEVKLLHGPVANPEYLAQRINARTDPRTFSCISVGESRDVVYGPDRLSTLYAKAKLLVRHAGPRKVRQYLR